MRLDFSNYEQLLTFLLSVVLGAAFCLLYDVLRYLHKRKISGTFFVFLGDVFYFVLISVATFCFFILYSKGVIRIYVYIGEILGFVLCRKTLSRLFLAILLKLDLIITRVLEMIFLPFGRIIRFINKIMRKTTDKIGKGRKKISRKFLELLKKRAKNSKKAKKVEKSSKNPLKL